MQQPDLAVSQPSFFANVSSFFFVMNSVKDISPFIPSVICRFKRKDIFVFVPCPKFNFPHLHDDARVGGDTGPQLGGLLADGAGDGGALHLALGVDDDAGIVLKVEEDAVEALPGLGLADNDGGVDLLAELGLALLDGRDDHVADAAGGQAVQAGADALDGDDVQVAGTRVVGAVHDGTAAKCLVSFLLVSGGCGGVRGVVCRRWACGKTYTGRPRVILSLPPGAPRLHEFCQYFRVVGTRRCVCSRCSARSDASISRP